VWQSLPYRESPQLSRDQKEHTSKECCLQLQRRSMDDIQRPNSLVAGIARAKQLYAPWHSQSLPYRESPQLSRDQHVCPSRECCLQLQRRSMDDIQRPNSLVAGIARAKHLYAPWHSNRCPIEKVLNFPETSMCVQAESVAYSSRGGPWMIIRGQVHWLQV
jgi:hypothetical protein